MKVRFDQSGGIAGALRGCDLDTTTLPPDQATELEALVKASAIKASGESLSDSGRDLRQYEIAIEDRGTRISVVFDDESLPPAAKRLVGFLKKCSRPRPLS